jgi:hypothetical protein
MELKQKFGKSGKDRASLSRPERGSVLAYILPDSAIFTLFIADFFENQLQSFVINIPAWFLLSFPII